MLEIPNLYAAPNISGAQSCFVKKGKNTLGQMEKLLWIPNTIMKTSVHVI